MIKRMILMIVFVVIFIGGMIGFKFMMAAGTKQFLASMPEAAQTVSTIKAATQDWQQKLEAVGSLRAANGADLAAETSGIVESLSFESGADVEKDAVLVRLRDGDDVAKLQALRAAESLAQITYDRDLKQIKAQAISQATLDADLAALNSAKAEVAAQQAVVNKKTIRAPFAGHLGLRQVDVGQFLSAGTPIVTLQQLDPIYLDFTLPEQNLSQISAGQKVTAVADALKGQVIEGEILAVNAKIDESTRNVQVRATFKNAERKLLPGMFAHVSVTVGEPMTQITIPQTAITYNPYGNTVYVVTKNKEGKEIASQTFVTLGATRGDQVAVVSGIKEGDEIVTSGQLKLRNGTPIVINNEIQPENNADPRPVDK